MKRCVSDQQTARANERTVLRFLENTPLWKLPRNQNHGTLNRTQILQILGVNDSAKKNMKIKGYFKLWDSKISGSPTLSGCSNEAGPKIVKSEEHCNTYSSSDLEPIAIRSDGIRGSRQEIAVLEWFIAYGRQIRH